MKFRVLGSVFLITAFTVIGTGTGESEEGQSASNASDSKEKSAAKKKADVPVPADQAAFGEAVTQFYKPYRDAPNELKKSVLRTKRKGEIQSVLGTSAEFTDWVATIADLSTNSDGNGILSVKLEGSGVQLKTWNNALSDILDNTLIAQSSPLFNAIAEMEEGARVKVSGAWISSDEDHIKESSMSEYGSMTDPEFIVRFSSVTKY